MSAQTGRAALQAEIARAKRAVAVTDARYMGLIRANVAGEPGLWFSRDAELQRVFQEGFEAGRALLSAETRVLSAETGTGSR